MIKKNVLLFVAMVLGPLLACSFLSLIPTHVFAQAIWISQQDLNQLPQSGAAYEDMRDHADGSWVDPGLTDQDERRDSGIHTLAGYYMWVLTGERQYLTKVTDQLRGIIGLIVDGEAVSGHTDWESHHTGRKLTAHVIAADGIRGQDTAFDSDFADFLIVLSTFQHPSGGGGSPSRLQDCSEDRPNNIGNMCRLAMVAIHAYLQDNTIDMDRLINVHKGYLGDLSAYNSFKYGNLEWQCDPDNPVGINPAGCTIQVSGETLDVGGGQTEELRRGAFEFPLPPVNYHWTNLQGVVPMTQILHNLGYTAWEWSDQAVKRALDFNHRPIFSPCSGSVCSTNPAVGDDKYVPFIANCAIGTTYPTQVPSGKGRTLAWTDWTHGPNSPVCGVTQNHTTPMPPENLSIE
ncbi:MAG: hypothetical protein O6932_03765 [Gammaproteobacteria bacterium]|nr:hypothetical protein [Gammaproteobacteria bacterium]